MLKSLGVILILISVLNGPASLAHESHGGGSQGAYGYVRLLFDVVLDIKGNACVSELSDATQNRLKAPVFHCRVAIYGGDFDFARIVLEDDGQCILMINQSLWNHARSGQDRWLALCLAVLGDEEADREGICHGVYETVSKYQVGNG